jgi:hypothetical protein
MNQTILRIAFYYGSVWRFPSTYIFLFISSLRKSYPFFRFSFKSQGFGTQECPGKMFSLTRHLGSEDGRLVLYCRVQGSPADPTGLVRKDWDHKQIAAVSWGLKRKSLWTSRYEKGGTPFCLISSQMPVRRSLACFGSAKACQSSKFMCRRPSLTSSVITQDNGAARPYQGQWVWFQWQSPQERSRAA